jgi:hypothetical protein
MMDVLRFEDVWQNAERLVGTQVRVRGRLFVGDAALIAADLDSCLAGRRMLLQDAGLIRKHLLAVFPACGGGSFIYNEHVTVTGTLQRGADGFELAALKGCTVTSSELGTSVDVPV